MKARKSTQEKIPKTYAALVGLRMPRPLHDEVDYRNALGVLDAMAGFKLNAARELVLMGLVPLAADSLSPIRGIACKRRFQFLVRELAKPNPYERQGHHHLYSVSSHSLQRCDGGE
jgi:hypothetical protein